MLRWLPRGGRCAHGRTPRLRSRPARSRSRVPRAPTAPARNGGGQCRRRCGMPPAPREVGRRPRARRRGRAATASGAPRRAGTAASLTGPARIGGLLLRRPMPTSRDGLLLRHSRWPWRRSRPRPSSRSGGLVPQPQPPRRGRAGVPTLIRRLDAGALAARLRGRCTPPRASTDGRNTSCQGRLHARAVLVAPRRAARASHRGRGPTLRRARRFEIPHRRHWRLRRDSQRRVTGPYGDRTAPPRCPRGSVPRYRTLRARRLVAGAERARVRRAGCLRFCGRARQRRLDLADGR